MVFLADADRTKEDAIPRVFGDEAADPFPKEEERSQLALVSGGDEGTPEFDRRIEPLDELGAKAEEAPGVKTPEPVLPDDYVGQPQAVSPGDLTGGFVPQKEVEVMAVEGVEFELVDLPGSYICRHAAL